MKLLIASPLHKSSGAYYFWKAFQRAPGLEVIPLLESSARDSLWAQKPSIAARVLNKLKIPPDAHSINSKLVAFFKTNSADIVFFTKASEVRPSTLREIKRLSPKTKLVNRFGDAMFEWHNISLFFLLSLKLYDLMVSARQDNCSPRLMRFFGAKKILYQSFAYPKDILRMSQDVNLSKESHDVLFIGSYERARFESMLFLAQNGIRVDVYGPYGISTGWKRAQNMHKNLVIHDHMLLDSDYSAAISSAKISLCFLRKINKDTHTVRTFEVPACRGFMLGERTSLHQALFSEGKEADYFDSNLELLNKVRYYLQNEAERAKIAAAGHARCMRDGHSYDDRAAEILKAVLEIG